ncbi:MAG: DUF2007 domain-containing protein [Pseudomonadota bacterium]
MKVIKRTHNQQEAKIIVSFLNAHGVEAELLDGNINAVLPIVPGGVRVAVPDDQEAQALRLLAEQEG